ncbi:MAG: DMT family transporter [Amphritea sp.]|nr:DMT family transporter [Amphritea sp.]
MNSSIKNYLSGAFCVAMASVCFSLQPIFAREIYADGANSLGLVWLRYMIPSVLLLLLLPKRTGKPRLRSGGLGLVNGLALLCYFLAIQQSTVSQTVMIISTFPLLVFIQAWIRGEEQINLLRIAALIGALAGVYLTLDRDFNGGLVGILFALGATLFYASFIIGSTRWSNSDDTLGASAWTLIGGAILFSVPAITGFAELPVSASGWSMALALGIIGTLVPFLLLLKGIALLQRQFDTALYSSVEPISAIFWAAVILQETVSLQGIAGGAIVIASVLLLVWSQARQSRCPQGQCS